MPTEPTLERLRSSRPFLFWWMIISLLLNVILIVLLLLWEPDAGLGEPSPVVPKRPPLAAAPGTAPPPAKSPAKKKPPSPTELSLSWQIYNILAVETTRPVLPEFQAWLAQHAETLRLPPRIHNAMVQAAADSDSAFKRLEHQRMSPGANGEWTVSISPADMAAVVKEFEADLSKVLDPETTTALVEMAEGWVPKGKNMEFNVRTEIHQNRLYVQRFLPETGQRVASSGVPATAALDPNGYWNKWLNTHFPQRLRELEAAQQK